MEFTNLPRVFIWAWHTSLDQLHIVYLLKRRNIKHDDSYSYCNEAPETSRHIFYEFHLAKETKKLLCKEFIRSTNWSSFVASWNNYLKYNGSNNFWKENILCRKLWLARNQRLLNHTQMTTLAITMNYYSSFNDSGQLLLLQHKTPELSSILINISIHHLSLTSIQHEQLSWSIERLKKIKVLLEVQSSKTPTLSVVGVSTLVGMGSLWRPAETSITLDHKRFCPHWFTPSFAGASCKLKWK